MRQLSDVEASFLFFETDRSPMHHGGVYLFEQPPETKSLTFETLRQLLSERLNRLPLFRQRLIEVPLNLDNPYVTDDPYFDLDHHVRHVDYGGQGSIPEALALAEHFFEKALRRDRPLWEIIYIDGLSEKESPVGFALVVKMHHAIVDAHSGQELMGTLLDYSPAPFQPSKTTPWAPDPLPSNLRLISQAYTRALSRPFKLAALARDTAASVFYTLLIQRLQRLKLPLGLLQAPTTPFNRRVSGRRQITFVDIPIERLKKLRNAIGEASMNDLILGICADALAHHLRGLGVVSEASLTALVPVSVRSKSLKSPTGSQMSAMVIDLATVMDSPSRRVMQIHRNALVSDTYRQAIAAERLMELVPTTMAALAARLYSEFQLAQRFQPLFTLPITNIPAPQVPLYLGGARLVKHIPTTPLFDGVGLVITATSYGGSLTITLTSCPEAVQEPGLLAEQLLSAVDRIEATLDDLNTTEPTNAANEPSRTFGATIIDDAFGLVNSLLAKVFRRGETKPTEDTPPPTP